MKPIESSMRGENFRRGPGLLLLMLLAVLFAALVGQQARAQGLIIDSRVEIRPIEPCEVRDLKIDATIHDQVAEVQVTQVFHNPSPRELQAELLFPLPADGAIQKFMLLIDGKEVPGKIMTREEARAAYEEIVRRRRDPALLEFAGRGLYRTSVFPVPPGGDRIVTMRYTQILPRESDALEFVYPLVAQRLAHRALPHFAVNVHLTSTDPIKSIYSPSHDFKIERTSDHEARATLEMNAAPVETDLRLLYTVTPGTVGATVLSWRPDAMEDGYFLMLASPEVKTIDQKPLAKNVIFVLDRSGSMSGKKIEQARNALSFVLDNLHDDDLFNMIVFDDRIESFKPELQRYSPASRTEAHQFIDNIRPGGSTNIDSALQTALGMLPKDAGRPSYVIFMTDGLPTDGEQNENKIDERARQANAAHAHLFMFGLGFDVNARLLDRLSGGNGGTTEFVKPDEDIEAKVARFYAKVSSPVMTDLKLAVDGSELNRVYPRDLPDLFAGGQLVVAGRYRTSGPATVRLTGNVGGHEQMIETKVKLAAAGEGQNDDYIERVWAARRIGYVLDDIDMKGQNPELTDELIALSKKYGILTPYTSYLAMEDQPLASPPGFSSNARFMFQGSTRGGGGGGGFGGGGGGRGRGGRGGLAAGGGAIEGSQMDLDKLADTTGQAATEQRQFKSQMQTQNSAASNSGAFPSASAAPKILSADAGKALATTDAGDALAAHETIRHIGEKTFYLRDGAWVDSAVDDAAAKTATPLVQFSDAYFALLHALPPAEGQYLSFREAAIVKLGGKVYKIAPPTP